MSAIDFRSGFRWNLALNVFTKIATPLLAVLIARNLGPAVMGAYAIVTTILVFSDIFRDSVLVRVYLRESAPDDETDRGYATLSALVHLGVALVVGLLGYPLARTFGAPELVGGLWIASFAVVLNGLSALPYTKLLRRGDFKRAALAESMGSVLSSVYAFSLVLAGAGFWALVTQVVVRSVIFLALTYRWAPVGVGRSTPGLFRRILGASTALTGTNMLWVGFSFGDQLVVSRLLGMTVGGFYVTGKMMVQTADVLAKPLMQTATVAFAERKHDREAVGRTLMKSLLAFVVVIVPVYAVVAIFARPLIIGVLSAKYAGTVPVVPALCVYFASIYPGSFSSDALVMAGKAKIPLAGWIATYVLLAVVLALTWGSLDMVALAWILAAGLVLVNLNSLAFALAHYRPSRDDVWSFLGATAALAVTLTAAIAVAHLPLGEPQRPAVALFTIPLVHIAAVGTFFARNPTSMFRPSGVKALWHRL
jgi:O-antigen/teichoic acid export membrane protein